MLAWLALSMTRRVLFLKACAHRLPGKVECCYQVRRYKKSWNIRFYRRPILIAEIRVSEYITHLRDSAVATAILDPTIVLSFAGCYGHSEFTLAMGNSRGCICFCDHCCGRYLIQAELKRTSHQSPQR